MMPPCLETSGEIANPDLLADAECKDPTNNHFIELRHELFSKLNKLHYETAENMGLEPDIEDLKTSNKFLSKSIVKVQDSVLHIHGELKRDMGSLNNEFIELQRKFVSSENKVLDSIESLSLQLINNHDHTLKQCLEDEAQLPEFLDRINMDPWTKVMDRADASNNAQSSMSTAACIIPVTMGRVPEFKRVIKGKVSEMGQPIASSSKTNVDHTDSVFTSSTLRLQPDLNNMGLFVNKLSNVLEKHMGQLGEKIDHLVSAPPS